MRPPDSDSNEGNTEVEGVESPRVWWVEPSPAGTTPMESVEESEEESEERARGLRELEGRAAEGEGCDVVAEVDESGMENPDLEDGFVAVDCDNKGDDILNEEEHGTAAGADVSKALALQEAVVPGVSVDEEEDAVTGDIGPFLKPVAG